MLQSSLGPRREGLGTFAALLYASSALASANAASTDKFDVIDYVDPFIGTANGGMTRKVDINFELRLNYEYRRTCFRWRDIAIWYVNMGILHDR